MKINELDNEKLANKLLLAPLASLKGKHQWMRSTFTDYIHVDEGDLEGEFVRDIILMDTPSIIEKWYGGHDAAISLSMNLRKGLWEK